MKTDELIDLLATDQVPPKRHLVWRRLGLALLIGFAAGAVMVAAWFGTDGLLEGITHPRTLRKIGFVLAVLAVAGWAAGRLARPGLRLGRWGLALLAAPFVVMALWGVVEIAQAEPQWRMRLWLGWTATSCPLRILAFSLPALAASLWAVRGLAPTELRAAGAAAGLFAGAIGTLAYVIYCREPGAAFIATWYLAGMALPATIGALLAPRALRW